MVATNNGKWAEKIRLLTIDGVQKGVDIKRPWYYEVLYPGYKCNLTDMASSLGLWQLKKLEKHYHKRLRIYQEYIRGLGENPVLTLPDINLEGRHGLHLFPVLINDQYLKINRDQFILELKKENISSNVHFIPVYRHPYYRSLLGNCQRSFPNTEYLYHHEMTLPFYLGLRKQDIQDVITAIKKIIKTNQK